MFREEYILKQDLAREEMQRRSPSLSHTHTHIHCSWIWCVDEGLLFFLADRPFSYRVKLLTGQKNKQQEDLALCREERYARTQTHAYHCPTFGRAVRLVSLYCMHLMKGHKGSVGLMWPRSVP